MAVKALAVEALAFKALAVKALEVKALAVKALAVKALTGSLPPPPFEHRPRRSMPLGLASLVLRILLLDLE